MLEKQEEKIIALRKLLEKPASIGILIHTNPDGDAVGSGLGLYHYLTLKGHTVTVISPTQLPLNMRWLPAAGEIVIYERDKAKAREILNSADILFFLDHNDLKRLGDMAPEFVNLSATSIMVDHHPQPLMPVTLQFSDTSKSSTAEYVGSIIMQLSPDEPLNLQSAESLFTGIVTDTGGFSYNSSRPETFEIVTQMLRSGINKDAIYRNIFDSSSESRMRMMGHVLSNKMKVFPELKSAYFTLTKTELDNFNYKIGDTEGFVNLPLSIDGIIFSAFFMEKDNLIKMSFRSKGNFDVNTIARTYFNGGGHLNAAGGRFAIIPSKNTFRMYVLNLSNT